MKKISQEATEVTSWLVSLNPGYYFKSLKLKGMFTQKGIGLPP